MLVLRLGSAPILTCILDKHRKTDFGDSLKTLAGRLFGKALAAVASTTPWRASRCVTKPGPSRGMLTIYVAVGMITLLAIKNQVESVPS